LYLVQANFSFLLLYCLKFILDYFFLSYFGLFESTFFHFELALFGFAAAVVGAASLAVIITRHDLAFGTDAIIAVERTVSTTTLFGWADRRQRLWRRRCRAL